MTALKPIRALVIEDSDDDVRLLCAELRRGGCATDRVRRVQRPEELARELDNDWDVILADYQLPSFNAREALEMLKERGKDIPFIVVSGSVGEDIAVEMMKSGAHDYFRKESLARLVPAIEREISEKRQRDARRALEREREALLAKERKARAAAEAASRMKDEFLATLSHELRTPLTAILGWAQLLRSGVDPAIQRHAHEVIERNARVQVQLIDDLLDVSRITSGKLVLRVCDVDLVRVIEAAVDVIEHAAETRGIVIHLDLDPNAGPVAGDPDRLQQVIWNLLSNAVRFTPAGGRVDITLLREGSTARLWVRDTGKGISPEFLPHVFERFRQEDSGLDRRFGGLGLGLSIAREIIALHGGSIRAESEGEGRGATFSVALPIRHSVPCDEQVRWYPALDRLDSLRVLVVDDDPDTLEVVSCALEQRGAQVVRAASGEEALMHLRALRPDALISDIGMPGMDGYELMREVRQLLPAEGGVLPAIALTAFASSADDAKALRNGFQRHISKPVDVGYLARVVADLVLKARGGFGRGGNALTRR